MAPEGAEPGDTGCATPGDALQLPVAERQVGRHDDDDRAALRAGRGARIGPAAIRQDEIAGCAEIGEHQRAERKIASGDADHPRGRADAGLEAEGGHARSGPHRPLLHRPEAGGIQRRLRILWCHGHRLDVVDSPVIALADQRIDRRGLAPDLRIGGDGAGDQCLRAGGDAKCVGEQDRRLDGAEFGHLHQPRRLAEAVDDFDRRARLQAERIVLMRQDGRDAGENPLAAQRAVADRDTRHIRDRIVPARLQPARRNQSPVPRRFHPQISQSVRRSRPKSRPLPDRAPVGAGSSAPACRRR